MNGLEKWRPPAGGVLAGMDWGADPFVLMDINSAEEHLGASLPLRRIEYLASQDAKDAGLARGLITDSVSQTQKPFVSCILMAQKFKRAYRPPFDAKADEQEPPYCVSLDGRQRTGGESDEIAGGQVCAQCPHSQWADDRETPPACSEIYTLLLWDLDDAMPFIFNIRRTGIKPWRRGRQALKLQALKFRKGNLPPNLCVSFNLGARAKDTYYLPTFDDFAEVDEATAVSLAHGLEAVMSSFGEVDPTAAAVEPEVEVEVAVAEDDAPASPPAKKAAPRKRASEPPPPDDDDAGPEPDEPETPKKAAGGFSNSAFARKPPKQ